MELWNKYLLSAYYVSSGSAFFECLLCAIQKQGRTEVGMVWTQSENSLSLYR